MDSKTIDNLFDEWNKHCLEGNGKESTRITECQAYEKLVLEMENHQLSALRKIRDFYEDYRLDKNLILYGFPKLVKRIFTKFEIPEDIKDTPWKVRDYTQRELDAVLKAAEEDPNYLFS